MLYSESNIFSPYGTQTVLAFNHVDIYIMRKGHDFISSSRLLFCIDSSTLKLVVCGSFFFAGGTDNLDVIKNMLVLHLRGDNVWW